MHLKLCYSLKLRLALGQFCSELQHNLICTFSVTLFTPNHSCPRRSIRRSRSNYDDSSSRRMTRRNSFDCKCVKSSRQKHRFNYKLDFECLYAVHFQTNRKENANCTILDNISADDTSKYSGINILIKICMCSRPM